MVNFIISTFDDTHFWRLRIDPGARIQLLNPDSERKSFPRGRKMAFSRCLGMRWKCQIPLGPSPPPPTLRFNIDRSRLSVRWKKKSQKSDDICVEIRCELWERGMIRNSLGLVIFIVLGRSGSTSLRKKWFLLLLIVSRFKSFFQIVIVSSQNDATTQSSKSHHSSPTHLQTTADPLRPRMLYKMCTDFLHYHFHAGWLHFNHGWQFCEAFLGTRRRLVWLLSRGQASNGARSEELSYCRADFLGNGWLVAYLFYLLLPNKKEGQCRPSS